MLLVVAVALFGAFQVFRKWQLRYTYECALTRSRHGPPFFYSSRLLHANKPTVRKWIAAELLATRTVDEIAPIRERGLFRVLWAFGEREDLEMLWRKGRMGYPLSKEAWDGERDRQAEVCARLVQYILWTCRRLADSEEAGVIAFKREFRSRPLAPEVRKVYSPAVDEAGLTTMSAIMEHFYAGQPYEPTLP